MRGKTTVVVLLINYYYSYYLSVIIWLCFSRSFILVLRDDSWKVIIYIFLFSSFRIRVR